ncbi:hypothetical protein Glove_130g147 [Diversispora epigaea]|uniref:Uncharacterized protein n=1 Tax=Diversispora epigaea TaxID=1348612 RepID=A0A397J4Q4_9GLOM|nr:hypothetical protein Glove_130g147 [Diversispora epigaea]
MGQLIMYFDRIQFCFPLNWGGVKLLDAFQNEKKYAGIFSNHSSSSNVERATCPSGYEYLCPGTYYYCETECGEVCEYDIVINIDVGIETATAPTRTTNSASTEEPEEPETEIPEPPIFCNLTADKIKSSNYRDTAKKADPNTFAYEYESNSRMLIQKTLKDIKNNLTYYDVEHVFEAQIITNWLEHLPEEYHDKMCCSIMLNLNELKDIVNDETNLRFLSSEINNAKGQLFAGNKISDPQREIAVAYYLAMDDIYNAF